MNWSQFVVCCLLLSWLYACKDVPQAPPEILPLAPTYTKIRIDSQFPSDVGRAIVYPSLVLSGTTTFGLTYGLGEPEPTPRFRFAGCPVACEERRNWFVGNPDTSPGDLGGYSASAAVDDRMQTAYQFWPTPAPPVLKYASCIALCHRSSSWFVTNVGTNSTGFFVSLAARLGSTHVAYVNARLSTADTAIGLRYAVCSNGCTTTDAWTTTTVDTSGYGDTQIAIDQAGVVHVIYQSPGADGYKLRYARCAAVCTTTANWQFSTVGAGVYPSLAVDASANLSLAYVDTAGGPIRVATCAVHCASGIWTDGIVTTPEGWANDVELVAAPSGKVYMTYGTISRTPSTEYGFVEYGLVRLGSCMSACSVAANWHFVTVDSTRWYHPWVVSMALDSVGRAGVAHADSYAMYFTLVKELP